MIKAIKANLYGFNLAKYLNLLSLKYDNRSERIKQSNMLQKKLIVTMYWVMIHEYKLTSNVLTNSNIRADVKQ